MFKRRVRHYADVEKKKVEKKINFHDTVFIRDFFVPVFTSGIFFNKLANSKISPQNKPIRIQFLSMQRLEVDRYFKILGSDFFRRELS